MSLALVCIAIFSLMSQVDAASENNVLCHSTNTPLLKMSDFLLFLETHESQKDKNNSLLYAKTHIYLDEGQCSLAFELKWVNHDGIVYQQFYDAKSHKYLAESKFNRYISDYPPQNIAGGGGGNAGGPSGSGAGSGAGSGGGSGGSGGGSGGDAGGGSGGGAGGGAGGGSGGGAGGGAGGGSGGGAGGGAGGGSGGGAGG